MYTGTLPATSVYGTWIENVEIWSTDNDELMDLSGVDEITLKLRDPKLMFDELTLTLTGGEITIPSPGIVQWRAEVGQMSQLSAKLYEALLVVEEEGDTIVLLLGGISIVE